MQRKVVLYFSLKSKEPDEVEHWGSASFIRRHTGYPPTFTRSLRIHPPVCYTWNSPSSFSPNIRLKKYRRPKIQTAS